MTGGRVTICILSPTSSVSFGTTSEHLRAIFASLLAIIAGVWPIIFAAVVASTRS